jgi:hypothetical protein
METHNSILCAGRKAAGFIFEKALEAYMNTKEENK